MEPLPPSIDVHPDHGMIGIHGGQVDTFDHTLFTDPHAVLVANDYEAYLRTGDHPTSITLHFTDTAPLDAEQLGRTTIELPTDDLIISEITLGAHGPFVLPAGAGIYNLTVSAVVGSESTTRQAYWLALERTGDPTPDDGDDA
ncbi:hypothetical protein [Amycolatopsis nalaikhensis]|uniref:Uncharacterized protein n=1 Tax=Amycolatopsis nalaikhensis TaxID=715472 RepID=A0ABY8XDP0_9PSEU|nr:hypothetical protein [Amycolatopsis sp. 2-2]WIV52997.1 hypothetical protein QP939_29160 [Amycolatopsis sp. 2-2]